MENKILEDNELIIKERKNTSKKEKETVKAEIVSEPVVAAEDISTETKETTKNSIKKTKKATKEKEPEPGKKQTKQRKTIKKEPVVAKADTNESAKNEEIKSFGILSDELRLIDENEKTKEEELYENFKKLSSAQKTKQLLIGEVYAVEPSDVLGKLIIAANWNGVKIIIPDIEYFEPNFEFGVRYNEADEEKKRKRREILATYQNGARVYFLVKACDLIDYETPDGETKKKIMCIASRKEAMSLVRDIYFFQKNRIYAREGIKTVRQGQVATAHVIAVKDDQILVECLGVETRILAKDATNGYLESCKDVFQPGDKIKVRIKRIHINGPDDVYLSVTAKLNEVPEEIASMQVRATYLGVVESVNIPKKIYNVRLKNNVLAGVLFDNVAGNIPLAIGTKVSVKITKILDSFVYGDAVKL